MASAMEGIGSNALQNAGLSKPTDKTDAEFYDALVTVINNVLRVGAQVTCDSNDDCPEEKQCCGFDLKTIHPIPLKPNKISLTVSVSGGGFLADASFGVTLIAGPITTYSHSGRCKPPQCTTEKLIVDVPYTATGSITLAFSAKSVPHFLGGKATFKIDVTSSGVQRVPVACELPT